MIVFNSNLSPHIWVFVWRMIFCNILDIFECEGELLIILFICAYIISSIFETKNVNLNLDMDL